MDKMLKDFYKSLNDNNEDDKVIIDILNEGKESIDNPDVLDCYNNIILATACANREIDKLSPEDKDEAKARMKNLLDNLTKDLKKEMDDLEKVLNTENNK